jgi:hypothetical protein
MNDKSSIPTKTKNTLIEKVFKLNRQGVMAYKTSAAGRKKYLAENPIHPVHIACMDGRANHLPQTLGIPVGVGDIFQTAGAQFSVASPYFANLLAKSALYAKSESRTPIFIVASHFSGNYPDHGCRAFLNNRYDALRHVIQLAEDIRKVFRKFPIPVLVLPVEFNTDDDSVIFFGNNMSINTSDFYGNEKRIPDALRKVYPEFAETHAFPALINMAIKNIDHMGSVRMARRQEHECHHGEFALAIGRGFGTWLNPHRNQAIILFGEGRDIKERIYTAGKILLENMKKNHEMQKHGALVISSSAYVEDWKIGFAMARAEGHSDVVRRTFATYLPQLQYSILEGVVNMNTWEFIEKERRWHELGW